MTRSRFFRRLVGFAVAATFWVAGGAFVGGPAQAARDVIRFGAALPLTGPLATEGNKQKTGYEIWKNLVNGRGGINVGGKKKMKVEIVYYDYESKTPTASKLYERLITKDKVDFLFGPFGSGATASVAALTERYKIPIMAPTASSAKLYARGYKFLFGLLVPNDFPADSFFQLIMSQNPRPKTMAFVTRNDFFPKVITSVFQKVSKKYGLKEVYYAKFPKDAKDMTTWLTTVKGKNPDVLMVAGYLGDLILATKQAKEQGVNPKAIFMTAGPVYAQFTKALGKTADGITTASWWADTLDYKGPVIGTPDDFSRMWKQKTGQEADYVSAASAASGVAYQLAIEKVGLDREKVRDALTAMDQMTFYGRIKFNKNGQNIGSVVPVIQIQKGKRLPVSPKEMAQGKYQYPKPRF